MNIKFSNFLYAHEHSANVGQTYKYEHSNDKEKTSSKWFTNVHKQFRTLHKHSTNVCNYKKKHPANGLQTLTSSSEYYINILQMFATACERL